MLREVHIGVLSASPDFLGLSFSVCSPVSCGTIPML